MQRLRFLLASVFVFLAASTQVDADQPNLLIITVDDMNCDSVGAFGCELEGTTPNIDAFAKTGMRFEHAHVQVGNCYPSRNVMFSGRYPHNTGVEGFYQVRDADYPHLVDLMKQAGYFVAIRGKVSHSTPYQPYAWDADLTTLDGQQQDMKNAESYYRSARAGIEMARKAEKPFCLSVNISDPHKPFYAMGKGGQVVEDKNVPSRVFTADEVPIPGFLFDHPDVRTELAHYYSSVRRADDCFAAVLRALNEAGLEDDTAVFFLSDHGMPLPFAKTALWNHSTRTPWIVRWPGVTVADSIDTDHMISAVDLLPTLLDVANIASPGGFDGRSFEPVLRGEEQPGRDMVYKVYNENSGANRSPMRSVQSKRFGYLFNPWSDGKRVFKTATTGTITYRTMVKLAETDPDLAARLELFRHGVLEEFYDYENDPDALHNLIDDPRYSEQLETHRSAMRRLMVETGDHALEAFEHRDNPERVSAYVDRVQAEADERRKKKSNANARKLKPDPKLFQFRLPGRAVAGKEYTVSILHRLPKELGQQQFHVTLKGPDGKRIDRIVRAASGTGQMDVTFAVPGHLKNRSIGVATFVGRDFASNRLHRNKGNIPVE